MKTWHWLLLGGAAAYLFFSKKADASVSSSDIPTSPVEKLTDEAQAELKAAQALIYREETSSADQARAATALAQQRALEREAAYRPLSVPTATAPIDESEYITITGTRTESRSTSPKGQVGR